MNRDGAIDLAAAAEKTPQRELDFGHVAVRFGHACEDLGRVLEAIVDEMVEAHVVVAWQAHRARRTITAPEEPGSGSDRDERESQEKRR